MPTTKAAKSGKHDVLKPLIYRKPKHELTGKLVQPGEAKLSFDHLDDAAYELLIAKRIIQPA